MSWAGAQATDLAQAGKHPLDGFYHDVENLSFEGSANNLNIPWLLGISVSRGNAATKAIAQGCVVFCEPEWGYECTGMGGGGYRGGGPMGGPSGGLSVSW